MTDRTCANCGDRVEDDPRTRAAGEPVCDLTCAYEYLRSLPAAELFETASEARS